MPIAADDPRLGEPVQSAGHFVQQQRRAALRLRHPLQRLPPLARQPPSKRGAHGRVDRAQTAADLLHLAQLTGGEFTDYLNYEKVTQSLSFLPDPQPLIRIHRLRTDTAWGLFLFGLLAIYWTGRKLVGMI